MRSAKAAWTACALAALVGAGCGNAQALPQTTPQSTQDALHAMSLLAGAIFAGRVVAVRQHDGINGATGVIEIEFAVEDAVRGVTGATYTLREWAGLWPGGDQPFRVGQRFLMLLHAPGAAGLSSTIGGMDGAIPIRGGGQAPGPQEARMADASAQTDGPVVDLRWIATRAARPISYRSTVEHSTALPVFGHPHAAIAGVAPTQASESPSSTQTADVVASLSAVAAGPAASQDAAYATVLATLRSWEKDDHAAR